MAASGKTPYRRVDRESYHDWVRNKSTTLSRGHILERNTGIRNPQGWINRPEELAELPKEAAAQWSNPLEELAAVETATKRIVGWLQSGNRDSYLATLRWLRSQRPELLGHISDDELVEAGHRIARMIAEQDAAKVYKTAPLAGRKYKESI